MLTEEQILPTARGSGRPVRSCSTIPLQQRPACKCSIPSKGSSRRGGWWSRGRGSLRARVGREEGVSWASQNRNAPAARPLSSPVTGSLLSQAFATSLLAFLLLSRSMILNGLLLLHLLSACFSSFPVVSYHP